MERGSERESEGSQSWRKVAELISGTSGKRSFPRIMRADPGELAFRKMLIASPALTLLFLSYQFSIRLSLSTTLLFPSPLSSCTINLRLRHWRICIALCVCVRGYGSHASSVSSALKRPLSYGTNRVVRIFAKIRHSSVLLFDNSFYYTLARKREIRLSTGKKELVDRKNSHFESYLS